MTATVRTVSTTANRAVSSRMPAPHISDGEFLQSGLPVETVSTSSQRIVTLKLGADDDKLPHKLPAIETGTTTGHVWIVAQGISAIIT